MYLPRATHLASIFFCALPSAFCRGFNPGDIQNIVTFGDSYTDTVDVADGGQAWPIYAAQDGNLTLYSFARSGATCSNNITYRPSPPVTESQLPTYFAEVANGTLKVEPSKTVYTLWIGTNDVGDNALLTGHGAPGVSIVNVSQCAVNWVKTLYDSGARNFIFQNMIPLQLTILYSNTSYVNRYWTAERNTTAWSVSMAELVASGNALSRFMLEQMAPTLKGAHIGIFDSHALFTDMYYNPSSYLNGTAPLNVTGCVKSCIFQLGENTADPGACTIANGTDRDSFLWYDELHPSEQADRIVGREIARAVTGKNSNWATWLI